MMCELFKLLRIQWMSRNQLAEELGIKKETANRWTTELVAQGILRERQAFAAGHKGVPPMLYTLAAEWGGQAT